MGEAVDMVTVYSHRTLLRNLFRQDIFCDGLVVLVDNGWRW